MSPVPSPSPLRRTLGRTLFSPAGLLFGFVVLLIATCPGARGDDSSSPIFGGRGATATPVDLTKPLAEVPSPRPFGRSTRFDRATTSAARSAAPADRTGAATDSFRHSRSALPLLVEPLLDAGSRDSAARITPMTGRPVGIRPKLPAPRH